MRNQGVQPTVAPQSLSVSLLSSSVKPRPSRPSPSHNNVVPNKDKLGIPARSRGNPEAARGKGGDDEPLGNAQTSQVVVDNAAAAQASAKSNIKKSRIDGKSMSLPDEVGGTRTTSPGKTVIRASMTCLAGAMGANCMRQLLRPISKTVS